ncbi:MAG: HipA N-terminal domain-containing protein [Bacteroidales bacterium]|nr:HipA N-terminal domain-containing protein [Bacteroidales bacterium]
MVPRHGARNCCLGETLYFLEYDNAYLESDNALPVSLTLPLRQERFESKTMFSFFDGLIPEGWLLNIAERNWKISRRDRMGLLLTCCRDCIGNVSVIPNEHEGVHGPVRRTREVSIFGELNYGRRRRATTGL